LILMRRKSCEARGIRNIFYDVYTFSDCGFPVNTSA
jgi:hypothetical protein